MNGTEIFKERSPNGKTNNNNNNNKKHMKKCSTLTGHKGNANQYYVHFHLNPVRMAIIRNTNNKCW
jgi:hypothetical protein